MSTQEQLDIYYNKSFAKKGLAYKRKQVKMYLNTKTREEIDALGKEALSNGKNLFSYVWDNILKLGNYEEESKNG